MSGPDRDTPREDGIAVHAYHLLIFLGPVGMLGGVPFANSVRTLVFGLPFLLFWIAAWVIATSLSMALLYAIDRRRRPEPIATDNDEKR